MCSCRLWNLATTLAKKIVTTEIFTRLIDSLIMWYRLWFDIDATCGICAPGAWVADRSQCRMIYHDQTIDQPHEYLGWNNFLARVVCSYFSLYLFPRIGCLSTINPEYFVALNFRMLGPLTFCTHDIFVQPLTAADSLTRFELFVCVLF